MNWDNAIELQASIFQAELGFEEAAGIFAADVAPEAKPTLIRASIHSLELGPVTQERAVEDDIAIGIKVADEPDSFELAIFVQRRNLIKSDLIERIRTRARGEAKTIYTGRIEARQWYRNRCNPLQIGCSCGHHMIGAGTLGCFVRDRVTMATGVLSNNHVLARVNQALLGDDILQPGALDGGVQPADVIAALQRFVPIILGGVTPNPVDCAFAQFPEAARRQDLNGIRDSAGTVIGQLNPAALVSATPGMRVVKIGRTTGYTHGIVTAVNVNNVVVNMGIGMARFDGQLAISSTAADQRFSNRGDSGSLIMTQNYEPVALLFAGGSIGGKFNLGVTFANPIAVVLSMLAVDII